VALPLTSPRSSPAAGHERRGQPRGLPLQGGGDTLSRLNVGNAIPWFVERTRVLASGLADADVPGVDVFAEGTHRHGAVLRALQAPSGPVAPIVDSVPKRNRDPHIGDRGNLHWAMIQAQPSNTGFTRPAWPAMKRLRSSPAGRVGPSGRRPFVGVEWRATADRRARAERATLRFAQLAAASQVADAA